MTLIIKVEDLLMLHAMHTGCCQCCNVDAQRVVQRCWDSMKECTGMNLVHNHWLWTEVGPKLNYASRSGIASET